MTNHLPKDLSRTRIANVFNHAFSLGGGEVSFSELIRSLDSERFDPVILVPEGGEIERQFAENGTRVFVTPFPPLKHIALGSPISAILNLIRALRASRVHIIHANGSRACFYSGLAGRILGVPVIWHVRESLQDMVLYDRLLGFLSNIVICVSNTTKYERFGRFGSMLRRKIHVVHNGVDTARFQRSKSSGEKTRRDLSVGKDEILFGIVGNIIPRKAQDFFLKGLAKAKQMKPDLKIKTLFIGRALDPPYREMLHQYISENDLGNLVIFRDYAEEIPEVLSALDIFVLSSRSEGFSRSLLEAMSSSLPVLGSKISEIEEAIPDDRFGLLVDLDDVKEMASAIIQLSENEKLRIGMGQNNRQRAVRHFDLKSHAKAVEAIYESLVPEIPEGGVQPSWSTS